MQISGDEDKVRLRILADAHSYKVGDTAVVKIHWRNGPRWAWSHSRARRVLGYRLVKLKTGVNELPVPMTAQLAPNFDLAISVMTDVRDTGRSTGFQPVTVRAGWRVPSEISSRTDAQDGRATRFHAASSPFDVSRQLRVACVVRRRAPPADRRVPASRWRSALPPPIHKASRSPRS